MESDSCWFKSKLTTYGRWSQFLASCGRISVPSCPQLPHVYNRPLRGADGRIKGHVYWFLSTVLGPAEWWPSQHFHCPCMQTHTFYGIRRLLYVMCGYFEAVRCPSGAFAILMSLCSWWSHSQQPAPAAAYGRTALGVACMALRVPVGLSLCSPPGTVLDTAPWLALLPSRVPLAHVLLDMSSSQPNASPQTWGSASWPRQLAHSGRR